MSPSNEPRRWTLIDWSDDYNPKWAIGDGTPPPSFEHLEEVVVMPVSEHEARVAALEETIESHAAQCDAGAVEIARLREAAQAVVDANKRGHVGGFTDRGVLALDRLRAVLAGDVSPEHERLGDPPGFVRRPGYYTDGLKGDEERG